MEGMQQTQADEFPQKTERLLVGFHSKQMRRILNVADRVAMTDAAVLITGENDTGKNLIAERIHAKSKRAKHPSISINIGEIPPESLKAAFIDLEKHILPQPPKSSPGCLPESYGTTLFLDGIAEIPTALQTNLLRMLSEKKIYLRLVSATNRDLGEEVRKGRFSKDLFCWLNTVEIHVPALRQRPEDIEPLMRHFVKQHGDERDFSIPDNVIASMKAYNWPGNLRELEGVCQRLVVLAQGDKLSKRHLPSVIKDNLGTADSDPFRSWPSLPPTGLSLITLEKRVIERALAFQNRNVSQTAVYLGIPRHVLAYRIQKYEIQK